MEKRLYSCDGGSLAVSCGGSIIRFSNGYGDGAFKVYHFDSYKEFDAYVDEHMELYGIEASEYTFDMVCDFKDAKVLDYDCIPNDKSIIEKHTIMSLNGRYFVYHNYGKVYFVKECE